MHWFGANPETVQGAPSATLRHASSMSVYTQTSPDGPQLIPIGQVSFPHRDA
jgi:hypothetical protein